MTDLPNSKDILETIAWYINQVSVVDSIGLDSEISSNKELTKADLFRALCLIGHTTSQDLYLKLSVDDLTKWASAINGDRSVGFRKGKKNKNFLFWSDLLKSAIKYWQIINNKNYKDTVVSTIVNKINSSAVSQVATKDQNQFITEDILKKAADIACISIINDPYNYLQFKDYQNWADILKKNFNVAEHHPAIYVSLEQGHKEWQSQCIKSCETNNKTVSSIVVSSPQNFQQSGTYMQQTQFSNVDIEDVSDGIIDGGLCISRKCDFCEKEMWIYPNVRDILQKLNGVGQFYCSFCIRNNFHTRKRNHVLILTFRGLIGYLYHVDYLSKKPKLYVSELEDLINNHVALGQQNPVFTYDADSYCWFVDFNKIGKSKYKISLSDVRKTIVEMLSAFNPYEYILGFKSHKYIERFTEAISDFYSHRYRPDNRKICAPTLVGCASEIKENSNAINVNAKKIDFSIFRNFSPSTLKISPRR